MITTRAAIEMAAQCRRAAAHESVEHAPVLRRQPAPVCLNKAIAVLSDDVGHLKGWPSHRGCNLRERFTVSGLEMCSASNGLATACK